MIGPDRWSPLAVGVQWSGPDGHRSVGSTEPVVVLATLVIAFVISVRLVTWLSVRIDHRQLMRDLSREVGIGVLPEVPTAETVVRWSFGVAIVTWFLGWNAVAIAFGLAGWALRSSAPAKR